LAMKVRNPQKPDQYLEQPIEGTVTETTEIWINGRAAKIGDLQVKDSVEATGYPQGKGENSNYAAETIKVTRPEPPPGAQAQPQTNPNTPANNRPVVMKGDKQPLVTSVTPPPVSQSEQQAKLRMLVDEFKKQRAETVTKRDALLKEGRPPN